MRIGDNNPVRKTGKVKKTPAAGTNAGGGFLDVLSAIESGGSAAAAEAPSVSPVAGVEGLLALQEVPEEEYARKKLVAHGQDVLTSLDQLRQNILAGAVPIEVLKNIENRLRRQRAQTADPRLINLIDEIELRAAVELAKWENAADATRI